MPTETLPGLELTLTGVAEEDGLQDLWRRHLHTWLVSLHAQLPTHLNAASYTLGLAFCDDAEISALNREWRGQEGPTDVLAFAIQDDPIPLPAAAWAGVHGDQEQEPLELGDIVISLETARRQAAAEGHSLSRELLFLASHGLLHLLGWDHPDDASLAAMLARQEELLAATVHLPLVAQEPCDREATG
jgi:probable rRNA maturation factor